MTVSHLIPDNSADPARAALDLIADTLPHLLADGEPSRGLLTACREMATLLDAAGALQGMSWRDARTVANRIVAEVMAS